MSTSLPANLAANLRHLREGRRMTQAHAARLAEMPRPTWASLESGSANPTLDVLCRAAAAMQVSIEELIGPPRSTGRHVPAQALRTRQRGRVRVRSLLPEKVPGMEAERLELPVGAHMAGVPHTPGTREYLACEQGRVQLAASGETWTLEPGDVVVFRGDQRHSDRNAGRTPAVAYSIVMLAPPTP